MGLPWLVNTRGSTIHCKGGAGMAGECYGQLGGEPILRVKYPECDRLSLPSTCIRKEKHWGNMTSVPSYPSTVVL